MSKSPTGTIDRILSELSDDDRADFLNFCRYNPTYSDIQKRLKEWGYDVTISSIQRWFVRTFPVGEEAKWINGLMSPYQGADSLGALSMSLGVTTRLVDQFLALLQDSDQDLLKEKPQSIAYQLGILLKEQRVTAQAIQAQNYLRDRKALELAGGYRVVEILGKLIESDPNRALIESFLSAAIAQLEDEVNRG